MAPGRTSSFCLTTIRQPIEQADYKPRRGRAGSLLPVVVRNVSTFRRVETRRLGKMVVFSEEEFDLVQSWRMFSILVCENKTTDRDHLERL